VDDNNNFASPLFNCTSSESTPLYTAPSDSSFSFAGRADTAYYWRVQAIDWYLNAGAWTDAETFYLMVSAPAAEISSPSYTSHDTTASVITVSGTVSNSNINDTVVIYTNYAANTTTVITAVNGSFSGTALVSAISDSIIVEFNDQFGRQSYDTITVNYLVVPGIEISYPSYTEHDTKTNEITIRGTTTNTSANDTVVATSFDLRSPLFM